MVGPKTHQQALFAGAVTPDEIMPPLLKSHPPVADAQLRRRPLADGQAPGAQGPLPAEPDLPGRMGYRSLLCVARSSVCHRHPGSHAASGVLVEITHPFSKHPGIRQMSPPNQDIFEISTFDGDLYTGTGNSTTGYGVYKTNGQFDGRYLKFHTIVTGGAGVGAQVTSGVSMHVYRHRLYVGSSGWYNKNTIPETDLIRIAPKQPSGR